MAKRKARKAAKKVVRKTPTVKGAKKRHDLGILFVHGIGQQARGDTLVRFGKPLYQWFERWIGADEAGPILSFDAATERLKKRFQKASTTNASSIDIVNASIRALPDDPAAPPQAEVQIRLPNRSGKIEKNSWLLVESWWAETFATPRFVDLARWGLLVVPWTFASHMGTHDAPRLPTGTQGAQPGRRHSK